MRPASILPMILPRLRELNWGSRACALFFLCVTTAIALPAQTLINLHTFDGTDGGGPNGGLIQATNGDLYGTTAGAGPTTMGRSSACRQGLAPLSASCAAQGK